MKKEWFVLHTLTGQEGNVEKSINARVKQESMEEYVGRCVIPMQSVQIKKEGQKARTVKRKKFPGYVVVELALYDDDAVARSADSAGKKPVVERTWQFVRATPGVMGFLGGDRPLPLRPDEVDSIFGGASGGQAPKPERPKVEIDFEVNNTVKIKDGPFMGLTGVVAVVDPGRDKLKVEVSIFNRKVQVDVEYWQVELVRPGDAQAPAAE